MKYGLFCMIVAMSMLACSDKKPEPAQDDNTASKKHDRFVPDKEWAELLSVKYGLPDTTATSIIHDYLESTSIHFGEGEDRIHAILRISTKHGLPASGVASLIVDYRLLTQVDEISFQSSPPAE